MKRRAISSALSFFSGDSEMSARQTCRGGYHPHDIAPQQVNCCLCKTASFLQKMKHWHCQYEAITSWLLSICFANMKRSTFLTFRVPKVRFMERSSVSFFMHRGCASLRPKARTGDGGRVTTVIQLRLITYDLRSIPCNALHWFHTT